MVLVADRGEGAGHRKEHHLAATKNLIRAANLWTSWRHNRERRFGDFIANLDCHGCSFSKRKDLSRSLTLYTESSRGRPTGSLCRKCAGEFCRLFVLIRSRTNFWRRLSVLVASGSRIEIDSKFVTFLFIFQGEDHRRTLGASFPRPLNFNDREFIWLGSG